MPPDLLLALLFLLVGALYASVGHAGASGYLAVMALVGVAPAVMRPTALALNILVGTIAFIQFWRAGHFRWRLFWPFAVASAPLAWLGGTIDLAPHILRPAIGAVLLLTAIRMGWTALKPPRAARSSTPPPVPAALLAGAAIGFVAGLTGTGGGIFLSPLILLLHWGDPKPTAAASALFILVNSIAGLAGQLGTGWSPGPELAWWALAAGVGGLAGATFGSRFAANRTLRALLALVLLVAGTKLVAS